MALRAALVVVLAVLVLASGVGPWAPRDRGPAAATASADVALVTDRSAVPRGPVVPLPGTTPLAISLTLAYSHPDALAALLAGVDDPRSPEFRHFLTADEFLARFGPSPSAEARVVTALRAAGATNVAPAPGGIGIGAELPASGLAALLGVTAVEVRSPTGGVSYTVVGTPSLPPTLRGLVVGVGGLSNVENRAMALHRGAAAARPATEFVFNNATEAQWSVGSDYVPAYGVSQLWPGNGSVPNATYPNGIAVATLLASGYNNSSSSNLPPWDPAVVDAYFNATLGPTWPMPSIAGVPVAVPGATAPPLPGSFGAQTDDSEDEYENSLDLEMAGTFAPGASLYNFYFAGSQMAGGESLGDLADDFAYDLAAALAFNYSPARLAAVSASFGISDLNDSLWNSELEMASATGVTVVAASGDQGDAPDSLTDRGVGPWPTWPATAAFADAGAISVGGAAVTLAGTPTSYATPTSINATYDPNVTGMDGQVGWGGLTVRGHYAGSEGGASSVYPEPTWQRVSAAQWPIVNATEVQGAGSLGRTEPDIAMPSSDVIAYVFANATGVVFQDVLGGTSIGAPMTAGLLADVVGVESARAGHFTSLGFIDPELYRIASFFASPAVVNSSAEAADPFLDVVTGQNYVFAAAPGWDAVTGWGGLVAPLFLAADLNGTVRDFAYTGPTPSLPPRGNGSPFSAQTEYLLIGIGALVAIALVVVAARPARRPAIPVAPAPTGPQLPTAGEEAPGSSSFACPYCGSLRPAEPVRCPQCGRY